MCLLWTMKLSHMFILMVTLQSVHRSNLRTREQGKKACSRVLPPRYVVSAVRWDKQNNLLKAGCVAQLVEASLLASTGSLGVDLQHCKPGTVAPSYNCNSRGKNVRSSRP